MVSLISFVVVLLAAASYSAPIDIQPDSSTLPVKNPNEQPVVHQRGFNNELTSVSTDRKDRSSEEKDSDELTTQGVNRPPRGFQNQESSEVTTPHVIRESRAFEGKDSNEMTTDAFTRPPRGFESKDSDEMTTDAFTRPPRSFDEMTTEAFTRPPRSSDEMTTEAFTRPPRSSDEMTTEAFTRPPRGFESKDSDEMTTDAFTRPPRTFGEHDSGEVTTEVFTQSPRSVNEYPFLSSTEQNHKRTVDDFLYSTLESSTQFNQRAIRPVESQEEMESSSPVPSDKKKSISEEPSSSVQSFGKSTGLLQDETIDRPNEQSEKYSQITKTVSIFPGKSSETKIYTNLPSKTSVVIEPAEHEQLSQVQHQSNIEKTKPNN